MKKNIRRSRRYRNPQRTGEEYNKPFFFNSDHQVQKKEDSPFFQPKLEVSPSQDPAEKEADAIAWQVVQNTGEIQRREKISRQIEEEEPQMKPEIQRQMEEEEPQMRLEVQQQTEEEEMPQARLEIQRQEKKDEEKLQTKRTVARQYEPVQHPDTGKPASAGIEQLMEKTRGQGFMLPDDIRQQMEDQFDADFSSVRIHTNADATRLNKALQAQAFTYGYDIYFNKGKYDPYTDAGKNLLAHELTHVVQQKGS